MPKHSSRNLLIAVGLVCTMVFGVLLMPRQSFAADQSTLDQKQQQISDLQNQKGSLESTLSSLNSVLSSLSSDIESAQGQIDSINADITATQSDLDAAYALEATQYENMKLRIKYTYEKGSGSFLTAILESDNLAELMNRTDEINQLSSYDRNMLNEYVATRNNIASNEAQLIADKDQLAALQADLTEKQASASEMIASTSASISMFSDQITAAEQDAEAYEAKLNSEKAAAAASSFQNASYGSSGSTSDTQHDSFEASGSDLEMLAAIICCEAGNQSEEGKIAVGSVVMNRVRSARFPNTISAVIYQSGQFTPVASGRFAMVLASGSYGSCISAAQTALSGVDNVDGCLFFCRYTGSINGIVIGDHVFY